MRLYFGGGEVPGHRALLAAQGVEHVSLSFVGLSRRIKKLGEWRIADKFPDGQKVFLDSGAYSLNKKDAGYTDEEAYDLVEQYAAFVAANISRITAFSEFDARQVGPSRLQVRDGLRDISVAKFMPIWHPEYGLDELEGLADSEQRVGVLQPDAEALGDLVPVLRRLAGKTKLHGVAMTRMDVMRAIPWDSVGSTSWLSPSQYGDTFVWTGKELKRYPKKYKDQSRKRHRTLFTDNGFDAAKIAEDDTTEVLKLSIWSWTQFVADIERHQEFGPVEQEVATTSPDSVDDGNLEEGAPEVDTPVLSARNEQLVPGSRVRQLLPVLSVTNAKVKDGEDGEKTEPRVGVVDSNLMRCDTCYLKGKCPQFRPGEECAFDIPMVLKTTTQVRALRKAILAMQAQRVSMMRMIEQVEGGYADPNASIEIGRLWKMIKEDEDADKDKASFEINVTASGNSGMISRIFGGETADRALALPAPQPTNGVLEQFGIVDAEVIEDRVERPGA